MPIAFSTSLAPGADVTLDAVSTQQYTNITPIDFSASVPAGSEARCIDLPKGLGIMRDAHRIIGAPFITQSATTVNIHIKPPTGSNFWVRVDITVTASADTVYDNGGSGYTDASFVTGLSEFGTSYTGAGCVVELAAGATIDISGVSGGMNNRFRGLTSPIIIKSINPSNPATITGKPWDFATSVVEETGNVSFVDLLFDVAQTSAGNYDYGDTLPTDSCIGVAGSAQLFNVATLDCKFKSDVSAASTKNPVKTEMAGIAISRDADRITVYGCEFTELFNGMLGTGSNTLFAKNTMHDCWGDMFRASTGSVTKTADYILSADNYLYDSVSDGLIRHADGLQMGGSASGGEMTNFERRGDVSSDTTKDELPAIAPGFNNSNAVEASTNQTASSTDDVLYRMETDIAVGDLSVTLPAISSVADGWECCVQKYSADTTHTVTVIRNGSDTINGAGANYTIDGKWMAVRFHKQGASATNWSIQIYSPGVQHGLYQNDGGLDQLTGGLVWYCAATSGQYAGHSFEVDFTNVEVENCTLVPVNYGDIDGDGVVTPNDFENNGSWPAISLNSATANGASRELIVERCAAAAIVKGSGATGTLTVTDSDTGATSTTKSTITSRYVGGGAKFANRLDAIRAMRHLKGGPLDGTGRGAIGIGVADLGYDFINMRPRLPGAPTVTTAPVISGSDSAGFTISTAAVFSESLTTSYQWLRDGEPISGATSSTYAGDTGAASGSKVSLRVTGASTLGDPIADSTNEIEKP